MHTKVLLLDADCNLIKEKKQRADCVLAILKRLFEMSNNDRALKKQLQSQHALVITPEPSPLYHAILKLKLDELPTGERSKAAFMMRCKILGLTKRNAETLYLKSLGLCYKEIAYTLCIEQTSVGTKLNRIYTQLEVVNIASAINKVLS